MEFVVQARVKNGLLYRAVKKCGSNTALAEYLGVHKQSISRWLNFKDVPNFRNLESPYQDKYGRWDRLLIALIGYGLEEIFPIELETHKEILRQLAFQEKIVEMSPEQLAGSGAVARLNPGPLEEVMTAEFAETIDEILETLSPREAEVVRRRFGLNGQPNESFEDIAVSQGVTRERIRQIEAKALRKLRHPTRSAPIKKAAHAAGFNT